eukprot:gene3593-4100_t
MPSKRSKNDTWKEKELLDAIKGTEQTKKKSSSSRSKESGEPSTEQRRKERKDREKEGEQKEQQSSKESHKSRREEGRERSERNEHKRSRKHDDTGHDSASKDGSRDREKRRKHKEGERGEGLDDARVGLSKGSDKDRHKKEGKTEKDGKSRDKERERDRKREGESERERHKEKTGGKDREKGKQKEKTKDKEEGKRKSKHRGKEDEGHKKEMKSTSKEKLEDSKSSSRNRKSRSKSGKHENGDDKGSYLEKEYNDEKKDTKRSEKTAQHKKKKSKHSRDDEKESSSNVEVEYRSDIEEEVDEGDSKKRPPLVNRHSSILRAEEVVNCMLQSGVLDDSRSGPSIAKVQSHGKIDFIAAKQKQITDKIANKTRQRGKELSKLIELDVVAVDLFELKPMNIYEIYMKNYGRSNTDQNSTQTREDDLSQETQTNDIEAEEKWCQFSTDIQASGDGQVKATSSKQDKFIAMPGDTRRLTKFLAKASQVCLTLLDDVSSKIGQSISSFQETKTRFSDGFTTLDVKHPMLQYRDFVDLDISPTQTNLLLTAYGPSKGKGMISQEGLVCLWNSSHPAEPQKFLFCESKPTCCCLSPAKASFAFAGIEDGSIAVWDLREASSLHRSMNLGKHEFTLRSETFSTAGVYGYDNHHSPVVSIVALMSPDDSAVAVQESMNKSDNRGMSFQIASLEENGTINIWVVIEIFQPDLAGSENDLGLLPGGKIKIIKSGSIEPELRKRSMSLPMNSSFTATCLNIDAETANTFYVGTDQGEVLHASRFGDKVTPRSYHIDSEDFILKITSLDLNPWKLPFLLVSSKANYPEALLFMPSLNIYCCVAKRLPLPIATWSTFSKGSAIIKVQWSRSKPGVFYALGNRSFFYVWNLVENRRSPILKEHLVIKQTSPIQFSLANDLGIFGANPSKKQPELLFELSSSAIYESENNISCMLIRALNARIDRTRVFFAIQRSTLPVRSGLNLDRCKHLFVFLT